MGLLDDAIREHLELRRRHGADPGEVARQEQEALGRVRRGEAPADEFDPAERDPHAGAVSLDAQPGRAAAAGDDERDDEPVSDPPAEPAPAPSQPAGEPEAPVAPPVPADDDESGAVALGERDLDRDEPADPRAREGSAPDERVAADDVLEETPEFLQETPEHDRLWFEQKPPRDFDF